MEIILIRDVEKFGKRNSVIKVKDGFARNFLFPRNLAIPATPANLERIEREKEKLAQQRQNEKEKALALSSRLGGISITVPVSTHDEEKLYGSIGAADIIKALSQEGISGIDQEAVGLQEPIKSVGVYEVPIKLHPEVSAKIKVWVVKG